MSTSLEKHRSSRPLLFRSFALAAVLATGCLTAGCDDGVKTTGAGGATGLGGAGGLGAAGGTTNVSGVASPGVAFLDSDYVTTSVSVYDPSSGKLIDSCLASGITNAVVTQPLSNDVVLPTQAQLGGQLVLIDRTTSVLTFVDPATCTAAAQLSVATGFKANPQDVVTLSSTKAYVTRYELNATPTATPTDFDEGDDLLIVDPTLLTVTGRIALSAYATPGPGGAPTQARPDRILLAGGLVYVTLDSLDAMLSGDGAGRVAIIDPTTDAVAGVIDLPTQKDCAGMTYVAATKKLYVSCGGTYGAATQLAESALVEIDLSGPTPVVGRMVQSATLGTGPLNLFYAAVSGDTAFVSTLGAYPDMNGVGGTSDVFYAVSLTTGAALSLATGAAGDLGSAVVDATTKRVFLPDGNYAAPLIRVYDVSGAAPVALPAFEPNPSTHLPPRTAAAF